MKLPIHDLFLAVCSCGWHREDIVTELPACKAARIHVNRSRKPGHVAFVHNMRKLSTVARYEKHAPQSTSLLDTPPF